MGHGITNENEAVFAHAPAWHRLGYTLRPQDSDGVTSEEIRRVAPGLFVERKLLPVMGALQEMDLSDPSALIAPEMLMDGGSLRLIARTDGPNAKIHGVATESYRVWQVSEAVQWVDALVREGRMRYESAFALFGGDRVIFVARMPTSFTLGQADTTLAYVMTVVPFTGSASALVLPTRVRVVCQNTERMALRMANGSRAPNGSLMSFNIRHSPNLDARLAEARKHLAQFDEAFQAEAAEAERLASRVVTPGEVESFLHEMFPEVDTDGGKLDGSAGTRREVRLRVVREAWQVERRTFSEIGDTAMVGSAWHLLNAVTRAADHGATIKHPRTGAQVHRLLESRKGDERARLEHGFLSTVDGNLATLKARARGKLLALAGA